MWIRRLFEFALFVDLALRTPDARAETPPEAGSAEAPEDSLAAYRERFKLGMDRYKAGALAEAIGYWEPIYRELGEQRGYRLGFNLGVAYQELGDATRAADRLQSFLAEVEARRGRGESLESIVDKEEADAQLRVAGLLATKGRIHVAAGGAPRGAVVDASEPRLAGFVAWVEPGDHTVTFGPGSPDMEAKSVHVHAGELVEVVPEAPPPASPLPPAPAIVLVPSTPAQALMRHETHHPFSWALIAVSGSFAAATAIAAVPLENYAWKLNDHSQNEYANTRTIPQQDRDRYTDARTWAYAVIGCATGFAAVTAGLAAWYLLGTSERERLVIPAVAAEHGGLSLGASGRF
jgi:hypothetical protein